ncbi:MAG TPA: hypothetical protein VGY77_09620 [Gemmataceae bacterium]|nr:hypothetical protein [Gemmataceae bacterium]
MCLVVFGSLLPGTVQAQRKGGDGDAHKIVEELKADQKNRLLALHNGTKAVTDADKELDKGVLDKGAKYYAYRLTNPVYHFQKFGESSQSMDSLVQETLKLIPDLKKPSSKQDVAQNQLVFTREFSSRLAKYLLEVLDNPRMIARVNAARILAKLGETGQEELADSFCQVIEDKNQFDGVKLYALMGLKNLFLALPEGFNPRNDKAEERELHSIKTLIDLIHRKASYEPTASEEEKDAFRYVRREAIRALGRARKPVVIRMRVAEARPALELLKIVVKDGLDPEPSISEQVEAAVGICQLQTKNVDKYQPDYAAYFIGRLAVDFAGRFEQERGQESKIDYKYYGYLFKEALAGWKAEADGKIPYLSDMIAKAAPVLNNVVQSNNRADHLNLAQWLDQKKPESQELYKNDPQSRVKPAAPAPEK